MSYSSNRSAPTSPDHQEASSPSSPSRSNGNQQQQQPAGNNRRKSSGFFGSSSARSGAGTGFDFNQFSTNIGNSLQDILSTNIFQSDPLMDMRKMLYKSCSSCGTSFSVFLRKKRCQNCMLHFCHSCMEPNRRLTRCRRCLVFAEMPLTKDALNTLRVRDLKWFLSQRNIPSDTFTEKRELIDLIIVNVNPPTSRRSSSSSDRPSQSSYHSTQQQPPSPNRSESVPEAQPEAQSSSSSSPARAPPPQQPSCSPSNSTTATPRHPNEPTHLSKSSLNTKAASNLNISTFNLNDIKDEADIKDLSIRQLKLLLTRNFVDFKGCVEREELIQKAALLWNDKQISNKFKDDNQESTAIDENVCKICMENAIDCVLLECGHMLTCTDCGKILSECPVCRQFVTRVVHVFKA